MIILIVALLVFGRRLPDVARSMGKSIVEFKKGLRDIKDDVEKDGDHGNSGNRRLENRNDDAESAASDREKDAPSRQHSTHAP